MFKELFRRGTTTNSWCSFASCHSSSISNVYLENSATPVINLPSPVENSGWKYDENGLLCHKLIGRNSVPNEIIELVTCKCKSGCSTNRCVCFKASLKCTGACLCINCSNKVPGVDHFNRDDDDDENLLWTYISLI